MIFKKVDLENQKEINDFLNFPKKIYNKKEINQDRDTETKLLKGEHTLSKYFCIEAYLLYVEGDVVCRCILTAHKDSNTCYLGLFESIDDSIYSEYFFKNIETIVVSKGIDEIIGPVDASFWIKYRMKISNFDETYTGEPSNKRYYYKLFKENGYDVKNTYITKFNEESLGDDLDNDIRIIEEKLAKRGNRYTIENLKNKDMDKVLRELYHLFSKLYSGFPLYKDITEDEFVQLFSRMLSIINKEFVLLAYNKDGQLVGFSVSLPDYKNLLNKKMSFFNIAKILIIKRNPKRVVNLYLGAKDLGVGKLLTYKMAKIIKDKNIKAVGALILKGKASDNYFKERSTTQTEYVILHKKVYAEALKEL